MRQSFAEWFEAQHGPRASRCSAHVTDDNLAILIERGKEAQAELTRRQSWDEKRQASLYTWQTERPTA